VNKFEQMKAAKDGLDVLPDLLRYAAERTPIEEIPPDDLDRMKWYGVFHRKVTPGYFMLRLRIPGGILTSAQARTIAAIAEEHGRGTADLTTRENIQLRWLTLPAIPAIFERLAGVGITTRQSGMDNARNITGCPLAGIDRDELLDATPLVRALHAAFLDAGKRLSNLPRKFNVSITGCREDCAHAQTQDLGFLPATRATPSGQQIGFNVLVGGALGGTSPRLATPLDVFVTPEEVVPFFLALLTVYRDHGPREQRTKARLKWLIAEWGEERLRAAVEQQLGRPLARVGRTETRRTAGDHLGVHPQRAPEMAYVGLHVPVGRIQAAQLAALADLADRYGSGELRLTVDQNVVLPNVPLVRVRDLLREPLLHDLRPDPPSVWRNLVACTGNDYCHFSLIDTKGCAVALARALEARGVEVPEGTRIHVSGCVHACGKHHVGAIGIEGANVRIGDEIVEAANVFVGGALGHAPRLAELVRDKVTLDALPDLAATLLVERCDATIAASEEAVA
jgi:ferredoxin-nitrite reductase